MKSILGQFLPAVQQFVQCDFRVGMVSGVLWEQKGFFTANKPPCTLY